MTLERKFDNIRLQRAFQKLGIKINFEKYSEVKHLTGAVDYLYSL